MKKKQFRKLITETSMILYQYAEMRVGQCLMNLLFRIDKDYYDMIAAKDFNPFYNESNVKIFLSYIVDSNFEGRDKIELDLLSMGLQFQYLPTFILKKEVK